MTAAGLLRELNRRGVMLRRVGDRLGYRAPLGVLLDADRRALTSHRSEILSLLDDLGSLERDGTAGRMREAYARLSADERVRFWKEVDAEDRLAVIISMCLAAPRKPESAARATKQERSWTA